MSQTRLSAYFTDRQILTQEEWDLSAASAATSNKNILSVLVADKKITTAQGYEAMAYTKGWKYQQLEGMDPIPDAVIDLIDASLARSMNVLPVAVHGSELTVATVNPGDLNVGKKLRGITGMSVNLVFSSSNELTRAVGSYYSTSKEASKKGALAAKTVSADPRAGRGIGVLDDEGEIVDALNIIIEGALRSGASDIHLEPAGTHLTIRYSIDNRLRPEPDQPSQIAPRLANLIKSRAKLNSSDLVNQDGVITHQYDGKSYDLRVAVLPAAWGESITLRMGAEKVRDLSEIGFSPDIETQWRKALAQPNGICLAVGPMGSGKTSLNYASLDFLRGDGNKIVSLEAPVEMKFPEGLTQISINAAQGLTWGGAMETVLRSAADVLFVGEINKEEVAHTAINAALTGHLVLSTLHTNDAPGSVVRLREMGIRASVLSDSMRAVCAQRLPRTLCTCKVAVRPSQELIRDFRLTSEDLAANEWFGPSEHGCEACMGIGYNGRSPIHELMTFPRAIRELIMDDAPNSVISDAARENGMLTLQDDGLLKVRAGQTSLEELRRHILID